MKDFFLYLDVIVVSIILIGMLIIIISNLISLIDYPTDSRIQEIKDRLLYYIEKAENIHGSKTGPIKLSTVYDMFCKEYPRMKKWISIEKISDLVDELLPELERIHKNKILL